MDLPDAPLPDPFGAWEVEKAKKLAALGGDVAQGQAAGLMGPSGSPWGELARRGVAAIRGLLPGSQGYTSELSRLRGAEGGSVIPELQHQTDAAQQQAYHENLPVMMSLAGGGKRPDPYAAHTKWALDNGYIEKGPFEPLAQQLDKTGASIPDPVKAAPYKPGALKPIADMTEAELYEQYPGLKPGHGGDEIAQYQMKNQKEMEHGETKGEMPWEEYDAWNNPASPINASDAQLKAEGFTPLNPNDFYGAGKSVTPPNLHGYEILPPEHPTPPATAKGENFQNFFGGSKAVDDNGNPLVLYHGTDRTPLPPEDMSAPTPPDFTAFKRGNYDIGSHFGTAEAANDRIKMTSEGTPYDRTVGGLNEGARTLPVYLAAKNPIEMPDLGMWGWDRVLSNAKRAGALTEADVNEFLQANSKGQPVGAGNMDMQDAIAKFLLKKGFDSIKYKNNVEAPGSTSWIALDPEHQVKSIFNSGEWNPQNADLLRSLLPVGVGLGAAAAGGKKEQ